MTRVRELINRHPNAIFWSCLLLLNFLLYVPFYLFFRNDAAFWPLSGYEAEAWRQTAETLLLFRDNADIFRLNFEFLLLVALWIFVRQVRRPLFFIGAFALYLLQLVYNGYEGFMRSYYLLDPVLYNDLFLFADGTRYALRSLDLAPAVFLGAPLLLLSTLGILYALNRILLGGIEPDRLSRYTRSAFAVLLLASLAPLLLLDVELDAPERTVTSFTNKMGANLARSVTARETADRYAAASISPFYDFTGSDLAEKPDIYFIFIESYGSVLYQREDFRFMYDLWLKLLERRLDNNGWTATSHRSQAPTWGGGSWISYTTMLSGVRIDSQARYLAFFNQYRAEPFPHLVNYLRSQGYRSYRISANSDELNDIEWQRYKDFYGVDQWMRFSDMGYNGPLYGWGPAPPDQYAVNFAADQIRQNGDDPFIFFYISQNSHYPWTPLPEIAGDWRSLVNRPQPDAVPSMTHAEMRRNYMDSIKYELQMLTEFIIDEGDDNDIFVLVGDHQPARVARKSDGWDTPMHIISRDEALLDAFTEFGFVPGLGTEQVTNPLRHEGFYSLFMRAFLRQYGAMDARVPAYLPYGIPLEE